MALLIDVYNELVKEATEVATKEVIAERVEILDKYATLATELLNAEFPNDYDKNDVIALADRLIERDIEISDMQEKQAEAKELLGEYVKVARDLMVQEYAENFKEADVEKLASTLYEMDCVAELSKEAQAIVEFAFLDELNKVAGTEFTSLDEVKEFIKEANPLLSAVAGAGKTVFQPNLLGKAVNWATANPGKAIGAAAGTAGVVGFGAGRLSKKGAFTEHGRINQEGRARGYNAMAIAGSRANAEYPGMAFLKETYTIPIMQKMLARRNAYAAQGKANYVRSFVPGVGMGPKGKKALEKLEGGDK